jgi:chloramphenicol 3-O-phosphotransferase
MTKLLVEKVLTKIRQAAPLYYRLVLLVAPSGMGKTAALQAVQEHASIPFINVNLELSKIMLELTERQRALQLPSLFAGLLDESA